jgi:hypothetical protein
MKKSKEDNKESRYLIFKTESSFCPECNENAYLLTSVGNGKPSFYICFNCKFIGEVGVGRVKKEE